MIRVLIADDHKIMRDGIRLILEEADDMEVAGEAADGNEAIQLLRRGKFDLVLQDMSMPGRSGVELVRQIKREHPQLPVLVLSMHSEEQFAVRCIRAGAAGYLSKDCASTELVSAIRRVVSGRMYITPAVAEHIAQDLRPAQDATPHTRLSDREFHVLRALALGNSITDIAASLHLSVKTVSTHKARMFEKMGFNNTADLVRYAIAHDLAGPVETPSQHTG